MNNVLIVGLGVTGSNVRKELKIFNPDTYDIKNNKNNLIHIAENYNFIFVCVDTPHTAQSYCDLSAIKDVLTQWKPYLKKSGVFVLKSTVLPGTTEKLIKEFDCNIVYSPEFYGKTQHCNNYYFNFTILGGNKKDCCKVQQLLQHCYDGRHIFKIIDFKTAELSKYMENCYLAMKVSFCSQFFKVANDIGVKYEDLRECFILDPRINPAHTFIYRESPFWDSHCLNKDVAAFANSYNAELIKSVIDFNNKQKNEYANE